MGLGQDVQWQAASHQIPVTGDEESVDTSFFEGPLNRITKDAGLHLAPNLGPIVGAVAALEVDRNREHAAVANADDGACRRNSKVETALDPGIPNGLRDQGSESGNLRFGISETVQFRHGFEGIAADDTGSLIAAGGSDDGRPGAMRRTLDSGENLDEFGGGTSTLDLIEE